MSKTLSQSEIDALLNSIGSDDAASGSGPSGAASVLDRSIKLYDFRRPDRFSKEHIRAIQNIHETYARVTASSLSSYLRSPTTVSLSSIEQVVYDEYVHQLANPTLVNLVELQPLAGRIVVEMNMNIGLAMLDRITGGAGQVNVRRNELTDIEMALLRSLARCQDTGGRLLLSTHNTWSLNFLVEGTYNRWWRGDKNWFGWDPSTSTFQPLPTSRNGERKLTNLTARWSSC